MHRNGKAKRSELVRQIEDDAEEIEVAAEQKRAVIAAGVVTKAAVSFGTVPVR